MHVDAVAGAPQPSRAVPAPLVPVGPASIASTPSLRSYFYRQPDHDFDDTEEAKRRRRELMKDLLTRMRLPDRAYFDTNLTPRQDIFWRAHSHPSFSSSPEWWPVLWS